MPSVLTCDCGARFEVDAVRPDQQICCPECLQSLQPTLPRTTPPLTSWLALASLALALVGAFTLVGSLAAVVLGIIALIHLRRHAGHLSGATFALWAIGLGITMTALSLTLFSRDALPIGAWLRGRAFIGQVEPLAVPVVSSRDDACLLNLPSADWLRVKAGGSGDPSVEDLQQKRDVLLVNVLLRAYADLTVDPRAAEGTLASGYQSYLREDLRPTRAPLLGDADEPPPLPVPRLVETHPLDLEGHEAHEWLLDLDRGGRTWRFLVRAYRRQEKEGRSGPFHVVRVYAPRRTFVAHEEELRRLLDGVRFPR